MAARAKLRQSFRYLSFDHHHQSLNLGGGRGEAGLSAALIRDAVSELERALADEGLFEALVGKVSRPVTLVCLFGGNIDQHGALHAGLVHELSRVLVEGVRLGLVVPTILRLHGNRLQDAGALAVGDLVAAVNAVGPGHAVHELHLSHNGITTTGAIGLVRKLAECKAGPVVKGRSTRPLWLRLECNLINPTALRAEMHRLKCSFCEVPRRSRRMGEGCGVSWCVQSTCPCLHLPFLASQLKDVKSFLTSVETTLTDEELSPLTDAMASMSLAADVASSSASASLAGATVTLFVLDSNAILNMVSADGPSFWRGVAERGPEAVAEIVRTDGREGVGFTFAGMLRLLGNVPSGTETEGEVKRGNETLGTQEQAYLAVIHTVATELDGLKKDPSRRPLVTPFLTSGGARDGCSAGNVLFELDADQAERVVKHEGFDAGASLASNDAQIVSVLRFIARQALSIGGPSAAERVVLVSGDRSMRHAARKAGVNTVDWHSLDDVVREGLAIDADASVDASWLMECVRKAQGVDSDRSALVSPDLKSLLGGAKAVSPSLEASLSEETGAERIHVLTDGARRASQCVHNYLRALEAKPPPELVSMLLSPDQSVEAAIEEATASREALERIIDELETRAAGLQSASTPATGRPFRGRHSTPRGGPRFSSDDEDGQWKTAHSHHRTPKRGKPRGRRY
jgi:hypothetical protein